MRVPPVRHLDRALRIGEALQPALAQRIERDDRHAAFAGFLQRMQHARRVGAGVMAEEEHAVGVLEILQQHRADRHPDTSGNATDVVSWHMFELSGRLLVPYMRPNSWYM